MAVLRVEDECDITPVIKVKNVPNPHHIYREIKDVLIMRCRLKDDHINEKRYIHEKGQKEEKIHAFIEAWRQMDKFTRVALEVTVEMVLRPVHKEDIEYIGDINLKIEGFVRTEYPQRTAMQKSILWDAFRTFYEKVLYGDIRENMMDLCRKYVKILDNELRAYLSLLPRTV